MILKAPRKLRNKNTKRKKVIFLVALFIAFLTAGDLFAYTYIYNNRTDYGIRLTVGLYDDGDKIIHIEAHNSATITTKFLLKNAMVEALIGSKWNQALHLTCDFLPGDHTFSIYVKEVKNNDGELSQNWNVITDDVMRMNKQ